jgi:hypothetical protein
MEMVSSVFLLAFGRCAVDARYCQQRAVLRDTLLPKLISDELQVKDAERALTDTPV